MKRSALLAVTLCALAPALAAQTNRPEIVDQNAASTSAGTILFGPSAKWLAVASLEGPVLIYDIQSGRLARTLMAPQSTVIAHPTRDVLAVLGPAGVTAWDAITGQVLWKAMPQGVTCAAMQFSMDGAELYAACSKPEPGRPFGVAYVKTFDAGSGREIASIRLAENSAISVFSPDGQWFGAAKTASSKQALAALMRSVRKNGQPSMKNLFGGMEYGIFETKTGRQIAVVQGVALVGLSPVTRRAIAMSSPGVMVLYDIDKHTRTPLGSQSGVILSRDGTKAFVTSPHPQIIDVATGAAKSIATTADATTWGGGAISADNEQLAVVPGLQYDRVLLFSAAHPDQWRMIGNKEGESVASAAYSRMAQAYTSELLAGDNRPKRPSKEESKEIQKSCNSA